MKKLIPAAFATLIATSTGATEQSAEEGVVLEVEGHSSASQYEMYNDQGQTQTGDSVSQTTDNSYTVVSNSADTLYPHGRADTGKDVSLAYNHMLRFTECSEGVNDHSIDCSREADTPQTMQGDSSVDSVVVKITTEQGTSFLSHISSPDITRSSTRENGQRIVETSDVVTAFRSADELLFAVPDAQSMELHFIDDGVKVYEARCENKDAEDAEFKVLECVRVSAPEV